MPPSPPAASGGKLLGMPRKVAVPVLIGGGVFAVVAVWMWWKGRSSKTSSSSASTTARTTSSSVDYAGELSVIQTELEELLGRTSTTGTTGTGSSGTGTGTKTSSSTKTTTTSKTTTQVPAMPSGVKASKTSTTTAYLTWNKVPNATSYHIRVTYQDKLVRSGTATTTYRTVNGMSPNRTYTMHVKACNSAGCSAETNGPTVKTKS